MKIKFGIYIEETPVSLVILKLNKVKKKQNKTVISVLLGATGNIAKLFWTHFSTTLFLIKRDSKQLFAND